MVLADLDSQANQFSPVNQGNQSTVGSLNPPTSEPVTALQEALVLVVTEPLAVLPEDSAPVEPVVA